MLAESVGGSKAISRSEALFYQTLFPIGDWGDKLVGVIAAQIGSDIVSGALPPGTFLKSVELAEKFRTSRAPVREALMFLEREGLVVIPPRRRPQVAGLSAKELREIYRIRELLLVDAIDHVVGEATDEDFDTLSHIYQSIDESRRSGKLDETFRLFVQFHDHLVDLSNNETLKKVLYRLRLQTLRARFAVIAQPAQAERDAELHGQLVRALQDRNAVLAKGLIQTLMQRTVHLLQDHEIKRMAGIAEPQAARIRRRKPAKD